MIFLKMKCRLQEKIQGYFKLASLIYNNTERYKVIMHMYSYNVMLNW